MSRLATGSQFDTLADTIGRLSAETLCRSHGGIRLYGAAHHARRS